MTHSWRPTRNESFTASMSGLCARHAALAAPAVMVRGAGAAVRRCHEGLVPLVRRHERVVHDVPGREHEPTVQVREPTVQVREPTLWVRESIAPAREPTVWVRTEPPGTRADRPGT